MLPPSKRLRGDDGGGGSSSSTLLEVPKHPYGVRPLGSQVLGSDAAAAAAARWDVRASLGDFEALFDTSLLAVLQAVAAREGASGLARMAQCSKALYIFATHSPLWRPVVLSRYVAPLQCVVRMYQALAHIIFIYSPPLLSPHLLPPPLSLSPPLFFFPSLFFTQLCTSRARLSEVRVSCTHFAVPFWCSVVPWLAPHTYIT